MAALVTIAQAKQHLRVTTSDGDADILLKVNEASAIVLDYLKARPLEIASISVANPTVITTSVPHSLSTGATATIAGTTSTPTVNGAQVVTVTGATTFTVPVNVTIGQASAAGTVGRSEWTTATVPGEIQAAVLSVLEDLYERRPINWDVLALCVWRHRDPALA